MLTRRVKVALGLGAIVGFGAVAGFGPAVRHKAESTASRLHATIEIEGVSVVWGGVRLHGVQVSAEDVPGATARFERVTVRYGLGGRQVHAEGGAVDAVGAPGVLVEQAKAWRAKLPKGTGTGGESSLTVDPINVSWKASVDEGAPSVSMTGVEVERLAEERRVSAAHVELRSSGLRGDAEYARLVIVEDPSRGWLLKGLSARSVEGVVDVLELRNRAKLLGNPDAATAPDIATAKKSGPPLSWLTDAVDARLAEGGSIQADALSAEVIVRGDVVHVGPGSFLLERRGDDKRRLAVDVKPRPRDGQDTSLTFSVSLPMRGATDPSVRAKLDGGPVHLAALGIQEGDFGLLGVDKAALRSRVELELSGDGKTLFVDGEGTISDLSLKNAKVSSEPLRAFDVAWRAKATLETDLSKLQVEEGEVQVGDVRGLLTGTFERPEPDALTVDATYEMPLTACQSLVDAAPGGLLPLLDGARIAGSFGVKGHAKLDTRNLDKLYDVRWNVTNSCRFTEVPAAVDVKRFRGAFTHPAYNSAGDLIELETGPETSAWTPIGRISRFMETGVITCEDGRFYRHEGFDHEAIRNSIRENLRSRRFVRGASTISMQLAKNLYLKREKTVGRKLQEALLTMYLEQELTKEQIIELYLNVVEFAPDVYGIGPAASHYFSSSPGRLSVGQAFYLASVLPNPKQQHFGAGGAVTPKWMGYLRTLMKHANKRRRLSDDDLDIGLSETVVRGSPAPLVSSDDVYEREDPFEEGLAPWETETAEWTAPPTAPDTGQ